MSEVQTERASHCPACGASRSRVWASAQDRLYHTTSQVFEYSRCEACQSLFQSLRPVESQVGRCYPDQYGPYASVRPKARTYLPRIANKAANHLSERWLGVRGFRKSLAQVDAQLKPGAAVLDFGCGAGKYLDHARQRGCRTIGMDFSEQALREVASRGHRALPVSDDSWAALGADAITLVRMNHVIEHLYRPAEVLRQILGVMAPGGVLHLSTPNPSGVSAAKFADAWWGLECPRHIVLMPPAQARALLEQAGFTDVTVLHEPIVKDLVRSWAYRRVDAGLMPNEQVEGLVDDGLLNLRFTSAVRAWQKEHQATDRYHIIARKPRADRPTQEHS